MISSSALNKTNLFLISSIIRIRKHFHFTLSIQKSETIIFITDCRSSIFFPLVFVIRHGFLNVAGKYLLFFALF